MTKILPENKQKILKTSGLPPSPSAGVYGDPSGLPLCWQERKPEPFYKLLLEEWNVTGVVDLSPGSGTLARACMSNAWPYLGICKNQEHSSWLQNVLNRRALQVVATPGSVLFEREFSDMITDHFRELLEELNELDVATDEGTSPGPC